MFSARQVVECDVFSHDDENDPSYVAIAASYIFTNFAVSHTHLDVVPSAEHRTWTEYAADHTMNCSNHFLVNWWMSYLNFQIEHHLWPQMPQFRFPRVAPR